MALSDDINLWLRDFTGYSGDGQGGSGALPVGDRSTARYPLIKRDLRYLFMTLAQSMGDPGALQEILDQLDGKADLTSSGKFFGSRADAVAAGQAALPASLGRVIVEEGDYIVWRGPGQTGDQLFSSYPNWGIVRRVPTESVVNALVGELRTEVRNGRVYYEAAAETPSGQNIPTWADFVTTGHNASGTTRDWRPRGAPEDGLEADNVKLDANGRWWTRMRDAAAGAAIRDGGIITTVNIGGTGDAITADIAPAFIEAGITSLGGASEIEYIPTASNTTNNPTLAIGGQTFGIRNADGSAWPAENFAVGRSYKLRRRGGILRVSNGDATSVELAALSFLIGGKADITNSGKIFPTRAAAEAAGQENIPAALDRITTIEGDYWVIRGTGATTDRLFEGYPAWGVIDRVPMARVIEATSARGDILMPSIEAGATAQAVSMTSDPSQAHISPSASRKIQIRWPVTNTGPDPVATLDGVPYTIKGKTGGDLAAGDLLGNGIYLATFFSITPGVLRLLDPVRIDDINGLRVGLSAIGQAAEQSIITAERVQSQVSPRINDFDYIASTLVEHDDRIVGQTADMEGLTHTSASGSRTMVLVGSAGGSPRFTDGGVLEEFKIFLSTAGRFSVSTWTEDIPGAGTTFTPYDVKYFDGVEGWNTVYPGLSVPKGGLVGWGSTPNGRTGVNTSLPQVNVRATSAVENEQFTAENTNNFRFMVSFNVREPVRLNLPEEPIPAPPTSLIDHRFTDSDDWTLNGASIVSGALESGANVGASPFGACFPTGYPYSQLARRTLTAFAEIVASGQLWGLSSQRFADGVTLNAPAFLVNGTTGDLECYIYDAVAGSLGASPAAAVEVPWTLEGSHVRLDVSRNWFDFAGTLTNLVTGQSVDLPLSYAGGTASNSTTGRPWGRPCVLFPNTTSGGVRVSRVRMVPGYPFPAGAAAAVMTMGDSITEGSQMGPDFDKTWSAQIEAERAANGARDLINVARGGQRSSGLLAATPEAVRMLNSNSVVVILIGTNDAGQASGSHAAWRSNVQAILDLIRTRTERIALCTLPPGPSGAAEKRGLMNADILGNYFGVPLGPVRFDLALSVGNDGVTRDGSLYGDTTHPNVAGNDLMVQRVRIDCPEAFE